MATNKNQHFVPRCYLRQFTNGSNKKAIDLFNIDRDRHIKGAAIKHQCSGDYFYGENDILENLIQSYEISYAETAKHIIANESIDDVDIKNLLRFIYLQYLRTDAASRRSVEMSEDTTDLIGLSPTQFSLKIKEAVQFSMQIFVETNDSLDDLSIVFLKNNTSIPFITSDDPSIVINKWAHNNKHIIGNGIGAHTAGLICILPISPTVCCCAYDGSIYTVKKKDKWLSIKNDKDIESINSMQYCNCFANLYFLEDKNNYIRELHQSNNHHRPQERHRLTFAVETESSGGTTTYVPTSPEEAPPGKTALIHIEFLGLTPPTWPSFFRMRSTAHAYTNGTGVGYIRGAHLSKTGGPEFKRVKVQGKMRRTKK